MKTTKILRALLIALSCVMVFCLFACDKNDAEDTTTEAVESNEPVETTDGNETDAVETTKPVETAAPTETTVPEETTEAVETVVPVETTEAVETTETVEATETETEVPECEHSVDAWAYASDNDPATKIAILAGTCTKCEETVTKDVGFLSAIENIYANDSTNPENVVVFQATADGNPAPIMSQSTVTVLGAGHPYVPAEGLAPIHTDFPGYGGMIGVSGWGAFLGSDANTDFAGYRITDAEGNVLVDWADVPVILTVVAPRDDVTTLLPSMGFNEDGNGVAFTCIINTTEFSAELGGQSVNVTFAYKTALGVDGDVYIPYVTLANIVIPAAQ